MTKKRLAIITTHPIQYNAPFFKVLAERNNIQIKVFYTWSQSKNGFFDKEFNKEIKWDIPLLDGYDYEFVENIAKNPSTKHFFGINCPTLNNKISEWNPDKILIYGWSNKAHFKVLKHFKGKINIYFRGDSTNLDKSFIIKNFFRRLFLKNIYKKIDYAFYVGIQNKKYFLNSDLKENQLFYLPYSIDNERFKDDINKNYEQLAKIFKANLGLTENDIVIAFIGKFVQKKNPIFLLKAVKKFNKLNNESIKLLFVGNGKLENKLKSLSESDNNIKFLPFQNQKEIPVIYRLCDIYVLPSKGPHESWGLSVNEALASNRLILISDKVGCADDLILNNPNGEIFKSNSYFNFQEKLIKLLNKKFEIINNVKLLDYHEGAGILEETLSYAK